MVLVKSLKGLIVKICCLVSQKTYVTESGNKLHYILRKSKKSNRLIVVFSGFAGHNKKARYNYMRTLHDANCNTLFILDDFGYKKVGSYYLGDKCKLYEENAIQQLIFFVKNRGGG